MFRKSDCPALITVTVLTGLLASAAHPAEVDYEIILESGDPAPGMPEGSIINGFSGWQNAPVLNEHGHLAFVAHVLLPDLTSVTVLYAQDDSGIHPVTQTGETLPQAPGPTTILDQIMINNAGKVAFRAYAEGVPFEGRGIWTNAGGSMSNVMLDGEVPPGPFDESETWRENNDFPAFVFNDLGQVAFPAMAGGYRAGIWIHDDGVTSLVAAEGAQAPDRPAGDSIWHLNQIRAVALNDLGHVIFSGQYRPDGKNEFVSALWYGSPGAPEILYQRGDPAPGTSDLFWSFTTGNVLNNSGEILFPAQLSDADGNPGDTSVWAGPVDAPQLIVREGDELPGLPPEVTLPAGFWSAVALNAAGRLATRFHLNTEPPNCIWREQDGGLELVVCEDDPAPGTDGETLYTLSHPSFNSRGQVAILARTSASFAPDALYLTDTAGELHLIILEDGEIELAPGDVREVTNDVGYRSNPNSGLEDGRPSGFNDSGEIAFVANFATGQALIVARLVTECTAADFDGSGTVNVVDLLALLSAWGPCEACIEDIDDNGVVNVADLLVLLGAWGDCP